MGIKSVGNRFQGGNVGSFWLPWYFSLGIINKSCVNTRRGPMLSSYLIWTSLKLFRHLSILCASSRGGEGRPIHPECVEAEGNSGQPVLSSPQVAPGVELG